MLPDSIGFIETAYSRVAWIVKDQPPLPREPRRPLADFLAPTKTSRPVLVPPLALPASLWDGRELQIWTTTPV